MRVDRIVVGERLREDYGDIAGLAASLRKYGLIQPVAVTSDGRLVAGGRRLRAVQMLGWDEVDTTCLGSLTPDEIRERELAENNDRQGLTAHERSKALVSRAKNTASVLAERISSPGDEKDERGRKANAYGVPKDDVAQAIGVGKATLVEAEQHVAAVDRYPELTPLEQGDALRFAKKLDRVPAEARPARLASLKQVAASPRRTPDALREVEREIEASAGMQQARLKEQYATAMRDTHRKLLEIDPEVAANLLDQDETTVARHQVAAFRSWLDRFESCLSRGIRLVGG